MDYLIVMDSCGEMTAQMKKDEHFLRAALTIDIDGYTITDDETFDQKDFLRRVALSPNPPKSACPSPAQYREAFDTDAEHIYAVTLSAELSGSYNSAQLGKNLAQEDDEDKQIYVFNSRSASVGETLIALKIQECEQQHMSFEDVIDTVEAYIDSQITWFVLESLEALRKNGRLSHLKATIATVLNIKPVMGSTPTGSIQQLYQARGMNKALKKMVEDIAQRAEDPEDKILAIAHCNCPERAVLVRNALRQRIKCKDILILDTAGISSLYASDGGVIVVA